MQNTYQTLKTVAVAEQMPHTHAHTHTRTRTHTKLPKTTENPNRELQR